MAVDEHCTGEDLWLLENHPNSSDPSKQYSRLKELAGNFFTLLSFHLYAALGYRNTHFHNKI